MSEALSDEDLKAIRGRCDKATPGPHDSEQAPKAEAVPLLSNDRIYNAAIDAAEDDLGVTAVGAIAYRQGYRRGAKYARTLYEEELARLRLIEERLRDFMKCGGIDALDALHILGGDGGKP